MNIAIKIAVGLIIYNSFMLFVRCLYIEYASVSEYKQKDKVIGYACYNLYFILVLILSIAIMSWIK